VQTLTVCVFVQEFWRWTELLSSCHDHMLLTCWQKTVHDCLH